MSIQQTPQQDLRKQFPSSAGAEDLLQKQRFRQVTLSKEVTSLTVRINTHSSNSFVDLYYGKTLCIRIQEEPKDSALVNITLLLSIFVSLNNSCFSLRLHNLTLSTLHLCIYSDLRLKFTSQILFPYDSHAITFHVPNSTSCPSLSFCFNC